MFKVVYLDQWADKTKKFINKHKAFEFALEKGYNKDQKYVRIYEIIPEQQIEIFPNLRKVNQSGIGTDC